MKQTPSSAGSASTWGLTWLRGSRAPVPQTGLTAAPAGLPPSLLPPPSTQLHLPGALGRSSI